MPQKVIICFIPIEQDPLIIFSVIADLHTDVWIGVAIVEVAALVGLE